MRRRATRPRGCSATAGRLLVGVALAGLSLATRPAPAAECLDWTPLRQPFFGDLHVHSSLSFDAYLLETRNDPRTAYRFARGEVVGLPPLDAQGEPTRTHRLRVPLDFAAVTDHSEMLGETRLCTVFGLAIPACDAIRDGPLALAFAYFGDLFSAEDPVRRAFCGADGALCLAAATSAWSEIQEAAAEFDDPSEACQFTTFIGYEWTATPGGDNLHRNVLFRGANVPERPLSYVEVQDPLALWSGLKAQCEAVGGDCRALSIPHNSNQSGGETFRVVAPDGSPMSIGEALLRSEMEPLVELVQHKGDSECRPGVGTTDELCGFEKIAAVPPEEDAPLAYVRNVLRAGLELEASLQVNPFTLGLIGSSDTHNGTPGATVEDDYPGHAGTVEASAASRLSAGSIRNNPGGLMVLWAEENTRDSLFDAMLRRESYATSGTRPGLRLFAGFDLPDDLCGRPDLVEQGYALGVPMGGRLEAQATSANARLVVHATRDPGTSDFPGTPLAEIQVVKGWLDESGVTHERVVRVAGGPPSPDAVDPLTCQTDGSGAATLCAVWEDDDFDPDEHAFYYARLLESPTCRWSTLQCRAEGVDCTASPPPGLEACCDGSVPERIQERATSSPVWVRPVPEPGSATGLAAGLAALWAQRALRSRSSRRSSSSRSSEGIRSPNRA